MIAMAVIGFGVLIKFGKMFKALEIGAAIARIWGSAFGKLGPIAGAVVAVAGTAALLMTIAKYTKAGDVMSPADGKTQVSTKEGGLFELSKNDDVAAGPGILDKLKSKAMGLVGGLTGGFGGGIESLANAFNNLISIVTSKFDLLIKTITEKQGEGNNLQKSTSENLAKKFSILAKDRDHNKGIHNKLAKGMIMASFGVLASGATAAIASDVISDTGTIKPEQEQTASIPLEEGKANTQTLGTKLDAIKKILEGKQNITIKVDNKLKYDPWEENNMAYVNGKESQKRINESSYE
jgi:hypothetical protein